MDQVLMFLNSIFPVSPEVQTKLAGIMKFKSLSKGDYILRAGEVCENIYFIKTGLLRCYYIKEPHDVSAWFMRENDTVVSVDSFYDQAPSEEYIHALEDCELFYINFQELEDIFNTHLEFNYNGRVLTLKYLRRWTKDLKNIRMLSAAERYNKLLVEEPELILRVPARYLASYLDMTPETYSRMRSQQ